MDRIAIAIDHTPIIDHHGHNLLLPNQLQAHSPLSITTEAGDGALRYTSSTISHIRAVTQMSEILGCEASWESVQAAIAEKRCLPDHVWAKQCFEGIETVLIDDGIDDDIVHPWQWHQRLTRTKCKRIVRIEKVAEVILKTQIIPKFRRENSPGYGPLLRSWEKRFISVIEDAIADPDVAGFKSVICYRTGLAIPESSPDVENVEAALAQFLPAGSTRLEDQYLSPHFVHLTAKLISKSALARKPFQFHTGLGDNDITLSLASPSHIQPFVKAYPKVPIVLLHAGYPFTKEAGYLASTYENVYLDIGEVFPMVSQDGQENVVRESLELCPSEKLLWSTDGHWFPETYLLAVIQVREAMKQVLGQNVARESLDPAQAIKIVEDVFFNTANRLYNLGLTLTPLRKPRVGVPLIEGVRIANLYILTDFMLRNPSIKFIRLQWVDYTSQLRLRVLPIKTAINMFKDQKGIGITKAVFGLLQQDMIASGFSPVGEYELIPCFDGLRIGDRDGYAIVQCEFRESDGAQVEICPRTALRRIVERAQANDVSFLIGFELEVVFMSAKKVAGCYRFDSDPVTRGHSWSNANALRDPELIEVIEEIVTLLERSQIELQQFHPESAPGQIEFITGPLPPLEAVDAVIASRNIVYSVAEKHGLKATFIPKPFPAACGTGAHVHLSMTPETHHQFFYAGILKHLRAISAFTYSNALSYDRMQDSVWSGGRYIAWGTQNRETPLRKIAASHWELKCMDGLANPYLALAAVLGAGLQGVLDAESLTLKDCLSDPALMSREERDGLGITQMLPCDLQEAMLCLDRDAVLRDILGTSLVDAYLLVKRAEAMMLMDMEEKQRRQFLLEWY